MRKQLFLGPTCAQGCTVADSMELPVCAVQHGLFVWTGNDIITEGKQVW